MKRINQYIYMKVLFITRGFPSLKNPMIGNYEAVQAKALAAKGLQVSVLSVYEDEESLNKINLRSKISHRRVDEIDIYETTRLYINIRFIRRINKYLRRLSYKRTFKKYSKEKGLPDIVHGHIVYSSFYALFIKKEYHIPFVITEHWTQMNVKKIPIWLDKMSIAYHLADQVICVSQALAESLRNHFHVESIIINNMVSDLFFHSPKVKSIDKCFKFVACGAFRKNGNKGFDILVDAFAMSHFSDNVNLFIIGDGEDRHNIENKIAKYNLGAQIHLLGTKTPCEVSEQLCNSDCFVLSSRLETFAIVVIEAMAKGLPIIATKCGGPETFLRPEHGVLVEKENVEQLSQAMQYMTEHYRNYCSDEIRQFCYDHFSQDVIAEQIIEVYKQVLSNRK